MQTDRESTLMESLLNRLGSGGKEAAQQLRNDLKDAEEIIKTKFIQYPKAENSSVKKDS